MAGQVLLVLPQEVHGKGLGLPECRVAIRGVVNANQDQWRHE